MPIYEYQCAQCGKRFERIQKFSDPPVEVCPSCGGRVERLLSPPGIQFKGSGWYVTDYARKATSSSKSEGDSASDDSSAKPADSTKSEKKESSPANPAKSGSED